MKPLHTNRRSLLAGSLAAGAALGTADIAAAATRSGKQCAPGFLWGTATAAHQVEGNNTNCDVWLLENLKDSPFLEPSGDACDHYHRYEADIALLARLGFNTYRFSVEWARIEPVAGKFSQAILMHYRRMLECCHRNGIVPVVTLHHFTSPAWFAAMGGFENPEAPDLFERYCRRVVQTLGDLMGWVCTFNEANLWFGDHPDMREKAGRLCGSANFSTFLFADQSKAKPNVHLAHQRARVAIKQLRPELRVGYTLAMDDFQDAPGANGRSIGPRSENYDEWLVAARADDFIGVQTYSRTVIGENGRIPPPKETQTQVGQEYYPPAVGGTVRYAAQVARVPVIVTENGVGIEDDAMRIRYIDGALAALRSAMDSGVDVRGYIHWSFMDNFEWMGGFGPKFGLIAIDRVTMARTPKPSAHYLGRIASRNWLGGRTR